ncbi:hypothetical protein Q4E93_12200 [Flavitalea sp. BT771]|uniref:hypothetical protein n=1 Tax=Flavitalea sp. BT771 TaxID=3063329 RepID=UPI0026E34BC6|nr:hypothetical protein [Flavitalea sp. BT771]MDO6431356.1 hypothetical protein [Flavitalea sp. BT771]MDV6220264.1 hypothetical protein [Flavitalea sp. BT771]
MRNIKISILIVLVALTSCKKSYIDDGGKSNPNVNMSTYDFLKSDTLFADLVHLIDRAGLKATVNGNITFFATTNYGVQNYLKAMKQRRAVELGDENITYTLDSIPLVNLDSLKTYMFDGKINRDQITVQGKLYNSLFGPIPNVQYLIKMTRTLDYNAYLDHVDYVTYYKVYGSRDDLEPDPSTIPPALIDVGAFCQTSGIVTTTGIVHVLNGYHRLLFNNDVLQ